MYQYNDPASQLFQMPARPATVFPLGLPPSTAEGVNQTGAFNQALPGFSGLSQSATDIVGNLLKGLPSAAPTQKANAYFGAASGMPGSDFVRNRGFDLYGQEAEKYKQRGLDNLLSLLQGYSGTVVPTAGQAIEANQFAQTLQNRNAQAAADDAMERAKLAWDQTRWGAGRAWTSTKEGQDYDRLGSRLGYDNTFDRRNPIF